MCRLVVGWFLCVDGFMAVRGRVGVIYVLWLSAGLGAGCVVWGYSACDAFAIAVLCVGLFVWAVSF